MKDLFLILFPILMFISIYLIDSIIIKKEILSNPDLFYVLYIKHTKNEKLVKDLK